jgi:hypothetical protein
LEPLKQAELQFTSRDDFQHLILEMIAKLSPCSQERLLEVVAGQAGRKSLRSRNKSIESVRKLLARRFVDLMGDQLVVTDAGRRHLQISSITEPMGSPVSSVRVLTTKQPQAVEWKEVASEFEKAVVALRTAEPVESPRELSLSSPSTLEAAAVSGSSMQEEVPFDLSPALALLATDIVQGHELKFEEKVPSAVTERHGLGAGEPDRLTQVPALCERPAEITRQLLPGSLRTFLEGCGHTYPLRRKSRYRRQQPMSLALRSARARLVHLGPMRAISSKPYQCSFRRLGV